MGKHTHSSQCVCVCHAQSHTRTITHIRTCLFPLNTHLFRQTKMFTVFTSTWCRLWMVFIFFFICLYFLHSPHWVVLTTVLKHPRPHLNALNSWCRLNSVKQKKKNAYITYIHCRSVIVISSPSKVHNTNVPALLWLLRFHLSFLSPSFVHLI